ncbi:HD domain-containing protein, partial [Gemmiger formicilis]
MILDRRHAQQAFSDYAAHYNAADSKIKLKIDHTYRVAALCGRIAASLGLSQPDIDLAWLCGLLHDVGRFEQLRQYGTFNDAQSIDHAAMSARVLFEEGHIRDYLDDADEDELLRTA